jgi:hypothetical protein
VPHAHSRDVVIAETLVALHAKTDVELTITRRPPPANLDFVPWHTAQIQRLYLTVRNSNVPRLEFPFSIDNHKESSDFLVIARHLPPGPQRLEATEILLALLGRFKLNRSTLPG